jgi:chromosome partitioning protein
MVRLLIASSKGGSGKSTLATNLAAAFAVTRKNTALVDTDPQRSSLNWCQHRPDPVPGVLGIDGTRRHWDRGLPPDTQRLIIDTPAGIRPAEVEALLEHVDVMIVPVLPSTFDLEAGAAFLAAVAELPRIRRGKVPVALVANRMKPWTRLSQEGLERIRALGHPLVAEVRDSSAYAVLAGLGKGVFDYESEQARQHQATLAPLLKWIRKSA